MDYRKNMNTPRDMVDDEMLLRLMREAEPVVATFGGNVRRENRRRSNTGNCGCRTSERREEQHEHRSGNRCGCDSEEYGREHGRRESGKDCGCDRDRCEEQRENRSGNRCGCDSEEYGREHGRRESGKDCGCDHDRREQEWNGGKCEGRNRSCDSCIDDERMKYFRLAMAYVPWQEWEKIHEDETALARGTLFEDLDLPWYQSACDRENGTCRKCGDNR